MSVKADHMITCPRCASKQLSTLWSVVNTRDTIGARQVRDQRLNLFTCDRCAHEALVDVSLLYHDIGAGYCVQYVSGSDVNRRGFFRSISKEGTYLLGEDRMAELERTGLAHPHFVFSMHELVAYIRFRDLCVHWGQ
jgi:transcription elongation factor Elf1